MQHDHDAKNINIILPGNAENKHQNLWNNMKSFKCVIFKHEICVIKLYFYKADIFYWARLIGLIMFLNFHTE